MLRTDPSMLASLSPNFFQTLSSRLTQNTTNSKVCLTKGCSSDVKSYNEMKWGFFGQFSFSLVAFAFNAVSCRDKYLYGFCSAERKLSEMIFGAPNAWPAKGTYIITDVLSIPLWPFCMTMRI